MRIRILLGAAAIALAISAPALYQSPAATIPAQKVNDGLRAKLPGGNQDVEQVDLGQ